MDLQNGQTAGQIVNRALLISDIAIEHKSSRATLPVTSRRIDHSHGISRSLPERAACSPDDVRALLTDLRSLLSRLSFQQAELERENQDLKRRNSELSRANARSMGLMEVTEQLAHIGGWEFDLRSDKLHWTKETCRIHELNGVETPSLDQSIEFFAPEARPIIRTAIEEAVTTGKPWDLELPLVTAKGNAIWVRTQGLAVHDSGAVVQLIGVVQDITDRKHDEAVKQSMESYLRESQKLEAVGELAGGVAHDFNNILAAIIGNADVALLSLDAPDVIGRCLREISRAGDRGRELVRQILSFGRPRATELNLISINPIVEESLQLLRATLPARIALLLECADNLPKIYADATQIEQVLVNLATNAAQAIAGEAGEIRIQIDSLAMNDALRNLLPANLSPANVSDRVLRVVVSDNGPGMSDDTMSRLFEPFFTTKPVGEGTGLGLAVVQGIVRNHQGAILVDSKIGQGAKFTIFIPACTVGDDVKAMEPSSSVKGEDASIAPCHGWDNQPRVLYVDDDRAVLSTTTFLLEHQGFRVSSFGDQHSAMEALRRGLDQFDLVVADYNMPSQSGIDFARAIRTLRSDIPIVIISGLIDDRLQEEAREVGVEELIAKPFSLKSFCAKLNRIVAQSSRRQGR